LGVGLPGDPVDRLDDAADLLDLHDQAVHRVDRDRRRDPADLADPAQLVVSEANRPMGDTGLEPVTSALSRRIRVFKAVAVLSTRVQEGAANGHKLA
jgi:hypothetical protein